MPKKFVKIHKVVENGDIALHFDVTKETKAFHAPPAW
jgi:hypothetical protein